MVNKKEEGKPVRIGPMLIALIDKQIKKVSAVTYGCVEPSPYDAGEILAKKMEGKM